MASPPHGEAAAPCYTHGIETIPSAGRPHDRVSHVHTKKEALSPFLPLSPPFHISFQAENQAWPIEAHGKQSATLHRGPLVAQRALRTYGATGLSSPS